jgi:hypothetical protein
MKTEDASQPVTSGSFRLVWTLLARSVGVTAGIWVALLIVAALISRR